MIDHTVVFRLRRPVRDEDRKRLYESLRAFAAEAPHTSGPTRVSLSLGLRETPHTGDALMHAEFEDLDAFSAYLAHERHQSLVREALEPTCEGWWSLQSERDGVSRRSPSAG